MKKVKTPILTFAELTQKPAGELAPMLKDCVTTFKSISTAQTQFTDNLQQWGKVTAAFERLYTERLNKSDIPANTSFKDYLQQNAGGEVPGRVLAVASLFNTLVLTNGADGKPLLAETHYDVAKVDHLEKANAIVNAARKVHGDNWKTCDDVQDVLDALSSPGDAGKVLKEIRARQKGEGKETEGDNADGSPAAAPLTLGRCVEFIKAAILNLSAMTADQQYETAVGMFTLERAWASLPTATVEPLETRYVENERQNAAPHLKIISAPAEAAPVKESRKQRRQREAAEMAAAQSSQNTPVETPAPAPMLQAA